MVSIKTNYRNRLEIDNNVMRCFLCCAQPRLKVRMLSLITKKQHQPSHWIKCICHKKLPSFSACLFWIGSYYNCCFYKKGSQIDIQGVHKVSEQFKKLLHQMMRQRNESCLMLISISWFCLTLKFIIWDKVSTCLMNPKKKWLLQKKKPIKITCSTSLWCKTTTATQSHVISITSWLNRISITTLMSSVQPACDADQAISRCCWHLYHKLVEQKKRLRF